MLTVAIIVFREVLEAALVIGLVVAATTGVVSRRRWISSGILAGAVGACIVAFFAERIAESAAGMGQELFNSCVLFAAVAMLGWHVAWMSQHGKSMASELKRIGAAVVSGAREPYVLGTVLALAVLREGSEVVLFVQGMLASGSINAFNIWTGGLLGLVAGAAMGFALYFGLLSIPTRYLFQTTNWLLILLAAGMASQAAAFLSQAGYLPTLGTRVWDSNWLLSEQGVLGQVMHALIGYTATPTGIQIVFYAATAVLLAVLTTLISSRAGKLAGVVSKAVAAAVIGMLLFATAHDARAEFKVYSPYVEKGELELEARGTVASDNNEEIDGNKTFIYEVGYAPTEHWLTAVLFEQEAEHEEGESGDLKAEAVAWENIFQLTEPGQYWADVGAYIEYEKNLRDADVHKLEGKLLLEKSIGQFVFTANPIFSHEIGPVGEHGLEFEYAWATRYRWRPELEPGFEAFGGIGRIDDAASLSQQTHQIGPDIRGTFRVGGGKLLYNVGYLFGLTEGSPEEAFKFELEYEHYF